MDPYMLARSLVHEFPEVLGRSNVSWAGVLRIAEFALNEMILSEWIAQQSDPKDDTFVDGQLPLFGVSRNGAYIYTPEVFLK